MMMVTVMMMMIMMIMTMVSEWTLRPRVSCSDHGPYTLDETPYGTVCPFWISINVRIVDDPAQAVDHGVLNFLRNRPEALQEVPCGIYCPFGIA